jgi:hypothetical protein
MATALDAIRKSTRNMAIPRAKKDRPPHPAASAIRKPDPKT